MQHAPTRLAAGGQWPGESPGLGTTLEDAAEARGARTALARIDQIMKSFNTRLMSLTVNL